jgi:cysteine-S-conjugate beta-lyase
MTVDLQALTPDRLRARRTLKWASQPPDVLAMWVAEMDYPAAPVITAALHRGVDAETFGYPLNAGASGLAEVLVADLAGRYGWTVDPHDVFLVADVMRGMTLALEKFSDQDDAVVITTPVYMPFFDVVEMSGRPQVHVPMADVAGRATVDLEALDRALAGGARTVLLCNPYNPLGRVFERSELLAFAEVVDRHGARVIADEIHAPLVLRGAHLPYASLSPTTADHTVTLISASKAWNLPGLKCAQVVTTNASDRAAWRRMPMWAKVGVSSLGVEASIAAYRDGDPWLQDVLALLDRHAQLVAEAVERMPGVSHRRNEGTYLAWLDFTGLELDVDPADWFLEHARVAMSPGRPFGAPAHRFARLNFATTTAILEESLERLAEAVEKR